MTRVPPGGARVYPFRDAAALSRRARDADQDGGGQGSGTSLSPAAARRAIAEAAEAAVRAAAGGPPVPLRVPGPIECRLQTQGPALADLFCMWPALERVDGVTVRFPADSVQAAARMLNCLSAMSFMLR